MFQGVYPAIVTPFGSDESVDYKAFVTILKLQEAAGVQGFYFGGTGGEGLMLSLSERRQLLELAMRERNAATKIIVHVSAFFPHDTIDLLQHAAEAGADAVALIPPGYYSPLDDDAVFEFYEWMAYESALPMMIYHLPAYSHYTISFELFERLMTIPNIVGIKDSAGNLLNVFRYTRHASKPVVLNGQDQSTLTALMNGAQGLISSPANIIPGKFSALWQAFQAGDLTKAGDLQCQINQLMVVLQQYPLVPAIKKAMTLMGMPAGIPRRPSRLFTPEETQRLREQLIEIGVLGQ